jgi:hypothetical protein
MALSSVYVSVPQIVPLAVAPAEQLQLMGPYARGGPCGVCGHCRGIAPSAGDGIAPIRRAHSAAAIRPMARTAPKIAYDMTLIVPPQVAFCTYLPNYRQSPPCSPPSAHNSAHRSHATPTEVLRRSPPMHPPCQETGVQGAPDVDAT